MLGVVLTQIKSMKLKRQLFHRFSKDLSRLWPVMAERYVCPVCMTIFERESINLGELTDGHVWPRIIRRQVKNLDKHRVLLCSHCNSRSGERGDAAIHTHFEIDEAKSEGHLYGTQRIEVVSWKTGEKIEVRGAVSEREQIITLHRGQNNPSELKRFHQIVEEKHNTALLIQNEKPFPQQHLLVGWVTAAYLYAFWKFGYRFILQPQLNVIRQFILDSFKPENKHKRLPAPNIPGFMVRAEIDNSTNNPVDVREPELFLMLPYSSAEVPHIKVNLLNFTVNLPVKLYEASAYAFHLHGLKLHDVALNELDDSNVAMICPCGLLEIDNCTVANLIRSPLLES